MEVGKDFLKYYSFTAFSLNLLINILGIIYFGIAYSITHFQSSVWNIIGAIIIVTWLINLGLIFLNDRIVNKSSLIGKEINKTCNYFLIFFLIAIILLVGANISLSTTISTDPSASILPLSLASIGYFGISCFGIYISYLNVVNLEVSGVWKFG